MTFLPFGAPAQLAYARIVPEQISAAPTRGAQRGPIGRRRSGGTILQMPKGAAAGSILKDLSDGDGVDELGRGGRDLIHGGTSSPARTAWRRACPVAGRARGVPAGGAAVARAGEMAGATASDRGAKLRRKKMGAKMEVHFLLELWTSNIFTRSGLYCRRQIYPNGGSTLVTSTQ